MPSFNVEVPHELGQPAAVEKLKGFLAKVEESFKDQVSNVEGDWTENVLNFAFRSYGFNISGVLTVEDKAAKITGALPFAAAMFRGKIESSIASELKKALTK